MKTRGRHLPGAMLLTLGLGLSSQATGIVVRGDAGPDAALADPTDYPEVIPLLDGRAVGTLIADDWVLTAAHVGQFIGRDEANRTVTIGATPKRIAEVYLHPSWDAEAVGDPAVFDLALLRLDSPVVDADIAPVYSQSNELGAVVTIVGWGRTGDGVDQALAKDGRFRRGKNRIDEVDPRLRFTFDTPASGKALPLEAVSGPGDSGGPAFITIHGIRFLAGVSSFQQDEVAPGLYGVTENYERVSRHLEWIRDVVRGAARNTGPADDTGR